MGMAHPAVLRQGPSGRRFPEHPVSRRGLALALGSVLLRHPVSDSDFRKNIDGLSRIWFQFPADISHIYTENRIIIILQGPPYMLNQAIIGQNSAAVFSQQGDNFEFILGQMDFLSVPCGQMLFKVNLKAS